jgi:hypothetical protein
MAQSFKVVPAARKSHDVEIAGQRWKWRLSIDRSRDFKNHHQ